MNQLLKEKIEGIAPLLSDLERRTYFNLHQYRYLHTLSELQLLCKSGKVLDVGIAPGHMAMALSRLGYEVSGVSYDPDSNFADYKDKTTLRERLAAEDIVVKKCDIQSEPLPFEDNTFDIILFTEILEHLEQFPNMILKEINRVLNKKNGYLILTTPNASHLSNRLKFMLGHNIYTSVETMCSLPIYKRHNREYTMEELKRLLKYTNFEVIKSKYESYYFRTTKLKEEVDGLTLISPNLSFKYLKSYLKLFSWPLVTMCPSLKPNLFVIAKVAQI
ncbi:MAG: class I SAM-dependent methyltransferase [Candidatus Omnitrophica bacterium]|nr:class I SAM-dependent methyltransferase [Candidatus Omnitrophota bacterium]